MRGQALHLAAIGAVLPLVLAASASPAAADAKSADKAFRKGKKLQQQQRYDEACPAFEESFREDPAIGAQLNVARCYEEWGKLATAYDAYQEALNLARATEDKRAPQIRELLKDLEKKVPALVISLPKGRLPPAGLTITLDGADLSLDELGKPRRVDPGPHVIVTSCPECTAQTTKVEPSTGKRLPVELPLDALAPAAEAPVIKEPEVIVKPGPPPGRNRRIIGLVAGGAGVVGLGVATYLALDARGDYNTAFDAGCDPETKRCSEDALAATRDARSRANTATIIGGVALAAVATGVVLYLTAPKATTTERAEPAQARTLRPLLWRDGAGLAFGGAL